MHSWGCQRTMMINSIGLMELSWTMIAGDQEVVLKNVQLFIIFNTFFAEPNNYLGFESCCTMSSGTGRWNDAYCSQPANGYVCKRPANPGQFTTAKPTQMPEGHCAEGYFEYRGYCYKLSDFSGDVSLHRNWTEAREECK